MPLLQLYKHETSFFVCYKTTHRCPGGGWLW